MMCCEGLGMPFHKTPYKFGNLFINFKIKFPEKLKDDQLTKVSEVLSSQAKNAKMKAAIENVSEIITLVPFEESQKNTHAQGGTNEDHREDDDEDDENGGG